MEKTKIMPINSTNDDIASLYIERGIIAIKEAISRKALSRLQKDLISLSGEDNSYELDRKLIQMNSHSDYSDLHNFQIAASKLISLSSIAADLYDYLCLISQCNNPLFLSGVGFVLGLPQNQRLAYDWHQDGTYHEDSTKSTIHVWFPIFYPVSKENGTMSIHENTHTLGLRNFEKVRAHDKGYTTNKVIDVDILVKDHAELYCAMNTGDCLFFCDEIIHKSNINLSNSCRITGVLKFSLSPSYDSHPGLVGV